MNPNVSALGNRSQGKTFRVSNQVSVGRLLGWIENYLANSSSLFVNFSYVVCYCTRPNMTIALAQLACVSPECRKKTVRL